MGLRTEISRADRRLARPRPRHRQFDTQGAGLPVAAARDAVRTDATRGPGRTGDDPASHRRAQSGRNRNCCALARRGEETACHRPARRRRREELPRLRRMGREMGRCRLLLVGDASGHFHRSPLPCRCRSGPVDGRGRCRCCARLHRALVAGQAQARRGCESHQYRPGSGLQPFPGAQFPLRSDDRGRNRPHRPGPDRGDGAIAPRRTRDFCPP